ncbi:hypothetical protein ACFX15_012284 [Malus domestica]
MSSSSEPELDLPDFGFRLTGTLISASSRCFKLFPIIIPCANIAIAFGKLGVGVPITISFLTLMRVSSTMGPYDKDHHLHCHLGLWQPWLISNPSEIFSTQRPGYCKSYMV